MQGSRGVAGCASVHKQNERNCIAKLMTLDWRGLIHQAGSPMHPRMWADHIYDPNVGVHVKPLPQDMRSARAALDERIRDQWCNGMVEEMTVICKEQADEQHASVRDQMDSVRVHHRAYVQKKGDAVRTATAVVLGNVWHGMIRCPNR